MSLEKRKAVKLKEIKTDGHNGNLFHELRIVDSFALLPAC
jgi:hypothetical protein